MVPEAMRILKESKVLQTWEDGARGYAEDGWSQAQALDPVAVLALDADAVCDCEAIILWLSDYQRSGPIFNPREQVRLAQLVIADIGKCHNNGKCYVVSQSYIMSINLSICSIIVINNIINY